MVESDGKLITEFGEWDFYGEEKLGLSAITYYEDKTNVVLGEILSNLKKRVKKMQ